MWYMNLQADCDPHSSYTTARLDHMGKFLEMPSTTLGQDLESTVFCSSQKLKLDYIIGGPEL